MKKLLVVLVSLLPLSMTLQFFGYPSPLMNWMPSNSIAQALLLATSYWTFSFLWMVSDTYE